MKKSILVVAILLMSLTLSAQGDFNKFTFGVKTGLNSVSDESATVADNYGFLGADVRYNINEVFGIGFSGGYDELNLFDYNGARVNADYSRIDFEATISLFEILKLRHKYINFQAHGGAGLSRIDTDNNYKEDVMNVTGGLTGLLKLSRSMALTVGYATAVHINQAKTLDGYTGITNTGINSTVDQLTVGLNFYFGKKERQHADFYVPDAPVYTNVVNNYHEAAVTNITQVINKCDCSADENVYFVNDKFDIGIQGLNAIEKIANLLTLDKSARVALTGSASPTKSTTDYYDLILSKNRVNAVKDKLIALGVKESQISVNFIGKDIHRDNIHEFARKVSLIVK